MHNRRISIESQTAIGVSSWRELLRPFFLLLIAATVLWGGARGLIDTHPWALGGMALAGGLLVLLILERLRRLLTARPAPAVTNESYRSDIEKIIQSTPQPLALADPAGRLLITNHFFTDLFDLEPAADFDIFTDPRIAPWKLKDVFSRALLGETVTLPEVWHKLPLRSPFTEMRTLCLRGAVTPLRNTSGSVDKVYIRLEDCTRHRPPEPGETPNHLRIALEGARQMSCEINLVTGRMVVEPHSAEISDLKLLADIQRLSEFEAMIHPEDRPQLEKLLVLYGTLEEEHFDHRLRIQTGPESWNWIQFRGCTFARSKMNHSLIAGVITDVTAEHERLKQLQESEAKFRTVFANAFEGLFMVGADDAIICVNKAFASILGYDSPEEFAGDFKARNFSQIFSIPRNRDQRRRTLLEKGEIVQMENQVRRRDGILIWISECARLRRNDQGEILFCEGSLTDITSRKNSEERILRQALFDPRTNLPNRSFLFEKLNLAIQRAGREEDYFFGLLYFDLDGFGAVNDRFSHEVGDRLLMEVARRVQNMLRPGNLLTQISGDKFAVIAEDPSPGNISAVAAEIVAKLEVVFQVDAHEIFVTASIGILYYDKNYVRADDMLRDAELAMWHAKKKGKNCWVTFSTEMYARKSRRTLMEKDLRRAMDRDELFLYYQPIVKLDGGKIKGLEALIRWKHPEHGFISPDRFIPLAEETGLIDPIGQWVLQESCRQIKAWRCINKSLIMNVNISGRQLEKSGLERKIYQILQEAGLDPECLNLEITESMAMTRLDANIRTLQRLKFMGIRLSIDDFGTGYSSLAHLQRFPVDELKIDRSFVNAISTDPNNTRIVRTIVDLAVGLNLELVAEGIETQSQLDMLKGFKCHYGQGYLFSKAMASTEIEKTWFSPEHLQPVPHSCEPDGPALRPPDTAPRPVQLRPERIIPYSGIPLDIEKVLAPSRSALA